MLSYTNALPQLQLLRKVSKLLYREKLNVTKHEKVKGAINALSSISGKSSFLQLDTQVKGEIGQVFDYVFDLIKIIFLIEPIVIFSIQKDLEDKKHHISSLFHYVAEIDVSMAVLEIREMLPQFVRPLIDESSESLHMEGLFHPLTINPVSNNLITTKKLSVLVSGSNMSGKTTFIRAIGINVLLGQTINTVCAKKCLFPPLKLFSAIRISDNLLNDDSYYFKEVKVIKNMVEAAQTAERSLFLLDELFKGTNTRERVAAGKAVLSYLSHNSNFVIAATHDLELTDLLADSFEFYHFSDTIENDKLVFDFKLKKGVLSNTNAIRILELNQYPKEIVEEALHIATKID